VGIMARRKYKVPSYIRPCDKCGQGKGYHSEGVDYRLCDTCFKAKCLDLISHLLRGSNA
jgi:hypothetical protein